MSSTPRPSALAVLPDRIQRVRRLAQLIGRQLSERAEVDVLVDRNQLDLLWLRLGQLRTGLEQSRADLGEGFAFIEPLELPTPVEVLEREQHGVDGRRVISMAKEALKRLGPALATEGYDPDDRTLDPQLRQRGVVVKALREFEQQLRARGVKTLHLAGSVARLEDGPDSDVDVVIEINYVTHPRFSLLDMGGILMDLQELLERKVDVIDRAGLRGPVGDRIERDLFKVF